MSEERKQREQAATDKEKVLSELELLKKQLADLQGSEEGRWLERKELFLSSPKFLELLGVKTSKMLMYGFKGTGKQFIQSGVLPRGADLSFLNPEKVWDELPESEKQGR